jgi:hypothetical protein
MRSDRKPAGAPRPPKRRGLRTLATLLALAILAALLFTRSRSNAPPEPVAQRAEPPEPRIARPLAPPPVMGPVASAAPVGSHTEPFDPHDTPERPPPRPGARLPYPPGSQPLSEGVDPATQSKEDDTVDAEQKIRCVFGPRVAVVHPPDPLVIDLEVVNKLGADMPISGGEARFRTERSDADKGPWFAAPLVDDGSGKDIAAGDYHYTATYTPSSDEQAAFFRDGVHVYVEVRFDGPNNLGARKYGTGMQYSREPEATLNGKYTDAIENGSLVVNVGITAKAAGSYRVIGTLYGGDSAIAFAQQSGQLAVGDGTLPLSFFGKIIYDRGIDGPYQVRYAMLFQHIPPEDIPGDTVDPAYTTQAYRARNFSDAPYVEPAPSFEVVDMNSPSQQGKPPPLYSEAERAAMRGPVAPIQADPPNAAAHPVPTGTK